MLTSIYTWVLPAVFVPAASSGGRKCPEELTSPEVPPPGRRRWLSAGRGRQGPGSALHSQRAELCPQMWPLVTTSECLDRVETVSQTHPGSLEASPWIPSPGSWLPSGQVAGKAK